MKLSHIFPVDDDVEIQHLMLDSREKSENAIFFCMPGLTVDGHRFAKQAVENGAVAIVHSKPLEGIQGVHCFQVPDVITELHRVTNIFFDYPSHKLFIYAITGTNGKSTTMKTVRNILLRFGVNAGYIGTISVEYNDHVIPPTFTTPDAVELQGILRDMVNEGVEEVCMEFSSQGIALRRSEGTDYDCAVFTNLSHDHLDYHKTMDAYFEAKAQLFKNLKPEGFMIFNTDDAYSRKLIAMYPDRAITYGINDERAHYFAKNVQLGENGTTFTLVHDCQEFKVETNFLALFNVYNVLAVIAILHQRGYAIERIIPELIDIEHVEGRLTVVDEGQPFKVVVDFGHAPDSMEKVYQFVRSITPDNKRMITVFGAAGGRDTRKRPMMGKISTEYCDHVIFTEHDNRDEAVEDITRDIITGTVSDNYEFVPIRIDAIEKALRMAEPGDSVVLIGKGEEKFIYREGSSKEKWMGDEVAAQSILKKMKKETL